MSKQIIDNRAENTFRTSQQFVENELLSENHGKKIAIFIVTYNAVTTLAEVLNRIPEVVYKNVSRILIFDDASGDATYELALGLKSTLPHADKIEVFKHPKNLGYGGNQKAGYQHLISEGFDVAILLHGDGQYAPEFLAELYHPLVTGEADAVFGSRMMGDHGGPFRGGMPLYKYLGNRILSSIANLTLRMNLTEFHSGYRAYNLHALKNIVMENMTDDFHFDTEIIVKLHHLNYRITERAIPTYYGNEICRVNGLKYAKNVTRSLRRYQQTVRGDRSFPEYQEFQPHYSLKESEGSSHVVVKRMIGSGKVVLDIGCGEGSFAAQLREQGNTVSGIDVLASPAHRDKMEQYYQVDLDQGLDSCLTEIQGFRYDIILLMDVLEHLRNPSQLLLQLRSVADPGTLILCSVPNVANITVRLSLLFGRFTYSEKGILDKTHLRFWTGSSFRRFVEENGLSVRRKTSSIIPMELVLGLPHQNVVCRVLNFSLRVATRLMPGLFGYQTILICSLSNNSSGSQAFSAGLPDRVADAS
ncbi:MAG: bifunctional glycosyltransferase/class I SAM-dependent methyltransferase [Verrucomicrobiales bacterium]|nr:bifunctional glycosyltransferase/class I SAM-dependent methyltransferase [Verrucomicrobiales bacterium]